MGDSYDYTDVYFRQSPGGQIEGTYRYTRNGAPASYKNEETHEQIYCDDGELSSDTVDYRYEQRFDIRVGSSDRATFTLKLNDSNGARVGEARGGGYTSSVSTVHADGTSSGLTNLLDNTSSIDEQGNSRTSFVALSYANVKYTAADGSRKWTQTTSGISNGNSSVTSRAKGNIDAEGQQVSGTSYDHSTSDSWSLGTSNSTLERKDTPNLILCPLAASGYDAYYSSQFKQM